MTTRIRKLTLADLAALQTVSITTFRETFAKDNTQEDLANYLARNYNREVLSEELQNPDSTFYFLEKAGEVAGYLKVNVGAAQSEEIADNALEVERIYVLPNFKRQGIGRQLIELALRQAQEQQKTVVWLGVWEANHAAIAFYQKMGFVKTGSHSFFMGDDEQTDYILTKQLT